MAARKTLVGRIDSEVLAFTVGKDPILDAALVEVDCLGSAAHVTMLSRMALRPRLFSDAQRRRVVRELVQVMQAARRGQFEITHEDQDVHLAVERRLTRRLGDLGRRIHTARSRNDQVALDLRLYAREELLGLMEEAATLSRTLVQLARRHRRVPMVGRTHLQPAMPSSVGLWASAYGEALLDDLGILKAAYVFNHRSPLGSAAGYGVPLPIDRKLTARLLGFPEPVHNVLYANLARGKTESVILSACAQVMITLSRLSEDLVLYSMPEFGYFRLPVEYCTGSSIMPQKRNPDVLELIRGKASRVLADAGAVAGIVKGMAGGYNRDLQECKEPFMEGLRTTRSSVRILGRLMARVEVDGRALRRGFTADVFATDRALDLVRRGMPFRDAYDHVKAHLGEVSPMSPDQALALKTHWGAPAGLDFGLLERRGTEAKRFVKRERARYYAALSRLLGIAYPLL